VLWVSLQQVTLVGPRSSDLSFGLSPRPEPARIDVAVTNSSDQSRFVRVIDFGRVDISDVLLCDLPTLCDRIVATVGSNEGIHDGVADLESLVLLPGIFRELSSSISNDPKVDVQSSCF
jgi:hypothetical protein